MTKRRDLIDYVNVGANVIQTAQLSAMTSQLENLAELETHREQRSDRIRRWREFLIEHDSKIEAAYDGIESTPKAAYTTARIVQRRFELVGFKPSVFENWDDIDRSKATVKRLEHIIQNAGARVGEDFQHEVTVCIKFAEDFRELEVLIKLTKERDEHNARKEELAKLEAELKEFPITYSKSYEHFQTAQLVCFGLGGLSLLFCFLIVVINPPAAPGNAPETHTNVGIFIAIGLSVGFFICGAKLSQGLKLRRPQNAAEYDVLEKRVSDTRRQCEADRDMEQSADQEVLEGLVKKFGGDGPNTKFVAMREERKQRWDHLFVADRSHPSEATPDASLKP